MRRNAPDVPFLLGLISCTVPGSHIFEKGFRPVANTRNAKPEPVAIIPDQSGLLRNSQLLGPKDLKKRSSVNLLTKR